MAACNQNQEKLLDLLRNGDEESFSYIYKELWPSLFNTAYKRIKDKEVCKDIVQNVFVDLWNRKNQVSINNLDAYLHTAVRYQVYKHCAEDTSKLEFFSTLENVIQSFLSPDESIVTKELSKLVELWIEALPRKRREIFLLHYSEQLSTKEIARRLNISQKTVQNQLNTATVEIKARFSHFILLILFIIR